MSTVDTKQDGGFLVQPVRGTPEDWAAFRALGPIEQLSVAMDALYKAMQTRGGQYVYRSAAGHQAPGVICRYLVDDETMPACLIGVALWQLGCPVDDLRVNGTIHALNGNHSWGLHMPTVLLWRAAQAAQDAGRPWADAVGMGQCPADASALPGRKPGKRAVTREVGTGRQRPVPASPLTAWCVYAMLVP